MIEVVKFKAPYLIPIHATNRNDPKQARNQLRTPGGAKSFLRGPNFSSIASTKTTVMHHIFPGGEFFLLCVPPSYKPDPKLIKL